MASNPQILQVFLLVSVVTTLLVVIATLYKHQKTRVIGRRNSVHNSAHLLPEVAHSSQKLMPSVNPPDYNSAHKENLSTGNVRLVNLSFTLHSSASPLPNHWRNKTESLPSKSSSISVVYASNTNDYSGVRPDSCTDCFRHDFDYLIQNSDICHDSKGQINLLMLIFTSHVNRRNRDAIRSTWASISRNNTGTVRYVFLLGKVEDYSLMKSVEEESLQNEDLLMEDFFDSYANLTYKTIMGYKWASIHCSQARFVLKTDDDMWINVPNLISVVNYNAKMLQNTVIGACFLNAGVNRNSSSKWYASFKSYPRAQYPGYCSGTGYVTSMAVVTKVYHVSKNVPFFHLEDVYIAFCVFKLGSRLKYRNGFYLAVRTRPPCFFKSNRVVTVHGFALTDIQKVWATKCP
ncbi:beta-1,3-galactosyltransferase 1-like [Haliotis asinina]|uniref:beta-1,3-galactosyltransferase 1-like n=1 Tax=Haliotis asinina TaxID=109174 RepID=UPI00353255A8